jgi:diguanylate cyclase (GGDEF)-like protein/PAS domain S-box-containing protein
MTQTRSLRQYQHSSEERFTLAARIANDGLWEWNLETNLLYLSPRWRAMLGCLEMEVGPGEWFSRVHPDDIKGLLSRIIAHLYKHIPYVEHEYRLLYKDGSIRWILCRGLAIRDENGRASRMAGSQTDITHQKEYQWTIEQLRQNALQDTLTFLPNRALFLKQLSLALQMSQEPMQGDVRLAVLLLDIDRFKVINSSLGLAIGDQLLIRVARRLQTSLPANGLLARVGNDEFTILLENVWSIDAVLKVAEQIQKSLELPFHIYGHEIFISTSLGIALSRIESPRSPEELLRDADMAVHTASTSGGACIQVFDTSMHVFALEQLQLEIDLRRAIEYEEFRVYYQPIVSLGSGKIIGFEALVRWNHPQRGLLEPADFIEMAEETGLINSIDRWVLREACRQLQKWQKHFWDYTSLSMSVNLSSKQFSQPDLVEYVRRTLRETGVEAYSLSLEITENVVMENTEHSISILSGLQALNIHVEVDDFGTGYSSLSYLHRLPTNTLKIDRSFVSRIGIDTENAEIVRTIIRLGQILEMSVIAEGVENMEQLEYLRRLDCCYAQGYLFSQPLAPDAVEDLLATHPSWEAED